MRKLTLFTLAPVARTPKSRRFAVLAAVAVASTLGAGSAAAQPAVGDSLLSPAASKAKTVKITLATPANEFVMIRKPKRVKTGKAKAARIKFVIRNKGRLVHEFVIVRSNRKPGSFPIVNGKAKVQPLKKQAKNLQPGTTRTLTIKLKRGKYVLLCNLPGHYQAGQFATFIVKK